MEVCGILDGDGSFRFVNEHAVSKILKHKHSALSSIFFSVVISTVAMMTAIVVMITSSSAFHSNPYLVLHCVFVPD